LIDGAQRGRRAPGAVRTGRLWLGILFEVRVNELVRHASPGGRQNFADAILADAAMSFPGFGVRPPPPTWGNMLDEGHIYIATAPRFVVFPGVAIVVTVLCLNLLGDAVRDFADPHGISRRRGRRLARRVTRAAQG
jgi:ABC-type antimicrobial peptide transport system permease subunit